MLSYCLKCKKDTENKISKVAGPKNRPIMFLSKFAVCDTKKSKFIKEQNASRLKSLRIKTTLNKIPLVGPFLL